jgi:hypothetical protein
LNELPEPSPHDLVGAYLLDALEPAELAGFEQHLAGCDSCRSEVAELSQVVDVLPLAVETAQPSAGLRDRVLAAIQAEGDTRPALTPIAGGRPEPRARRRLGWLEAVAGLAAVAVLAALGIWNLQLQSKVDKQQAQLKFQRAVASALASGATVTTMASTGPGRGAEAAMVQSHKGKPAYLIVEGLPQTPSNKTYELWLVKKTPVPAGTFRYSGSDPQIVRLPISSAGYPVAAVTLEPGHGGSAPKGPFVLQAKLRA